MPQQGTSNEYHNIYLFGEIEKKILSFDKLAISGAMYVVQYFFNLSTKTFFKRNASMSFAGISAKGGNLYHSGLNLAIVFICSPEIRI